MLGSILASGAYAQASLKTSFSPAFATKSASIGDIAGALQTSGKARVIVVVKVPGQTADSLATLGAVKGGAKIGAPDAQAAVKKAIASAVSQVTEAHALTEANGKLLKFATVPGFAVEVTKAQLETLAADPNVASINYDRPMQKQLNLSLGFDKVPSIHTAGATGVGKAVVHIDDGIQRDHPFLGVSRLVTGLEACFTPNSSCPNATGTQIGTGAAAAQGTATHGTHTAGIVLGSRASGIPDKGNAPNARLLPINIFGTASTTPFSIIQRAFEQAEAWVGTTNPQGIAAVTMSVGGGSSVGACDADPTMALLKPVVDRLRAKGVLSVVSAGNDSARNAQSFPACISSIVSVGAIQRDAAITSSYTNIAAGTDLLAPGGDFTGSGCILSSVRLSGFGQLCGTSMAAPQVSGIIAALKSRVTTATADQMELALKATGINVVDTRTGGVNTKPRVVADRALNALSTTLLRPGNDNFANAFTVPSRNITMTGTNFGATFEAGEPRRVVAGASNSVWWKITAGVSGPITVDTLGSDFDTVLSVISGATNATNGTIIASNDDFGGTLKSKVTFNAVQGQTYHVLVTGFNSLAFGTIALKFSAPAVNDNFSGIFWGVGCCGPIVAASGNNFLTTKEVGEPNHAGQAGATTSVWFSFVAPVSGQIILHTLGSDFDTVLAVYTGGAVGALSPIASNDDYGTSRQSAVFFNAVQGTTYRVAIAGFNGAQGNYRLTWQLPGAFAVESVSASNDAPTKAVD